MEGTASEKAVHHGRDPGHEGGACVGEEAQGGAIGEASSDTTDGLYQPEPRRDIPGLPLGADENGGGRPPRHEREVRSGTAEAARLSLPAQAGPPVQPRGDVHDARSRAVVPELREDRPGARQTPSKKRPTGHDNPGLGQPWQARDAKQDVALSVEPRERRAPVGETFDEGAGAVDGINHPPAARRERRVRWPNGTALLAPQRIERKQRLDLGDEHGLAGVIGVRDGRAVRLAMYSEAAGKVRQRDRVHRCHRRKERDHAAVLKGVGHGRRVIRNPGARACYGAAPESSVGKASLRLLGPYAAWSPAVREAVYTRDGAPDAQMLVRVDGPAVSEEAMARARTEVKLLSRLRHDHVLRMDFVSAVGGRVGQVYEHPGGAGLSRVCNAELAMGRPFPLRVTVEIAAGVASALDEACRVQQGTMRVDHPGPELQDLLIERSGRTKLAGFVVTEAGQVPGLTRRRGFSPPDGGEGTPATMTWMAAQFLSTLIRTTGREGEVTPSLAAALKSAFDTNASIRPGPGQFAKMLREIAGTMPGQSIRVWADIPVREALTSGRNADADVETLRVAPEQPVIAGGPTIVPDMETEEPPITGPERTAVRGFPASHGTIVPEMLDMETEEPGVSATGSRARIPSARAPATLPVQPLPISVGPSGGTISGATVVDDPRPPATARPSASATLPPGAFWGPANQSGMHPSVTSRLSTGGPTFPTITSEQPVQVGRKGPPLEAEPGFNGPAVGSPVPGLGAPPLSGTGPMPGGPGPAISPSDPLTPRRVEPMSDGPRVDLAMDGSGLDLPEQDPAPPSRTGLYIAVGAVLGLCLVGLIAACGLVWWYEQRAETIVVTPPPAGLADTPSDAPVAPSTPAATPSTPPATPSTPAATPPAAPASVPATTPSAAHPPAESPHAQPSRPATTAASPADTEPARITGTPAADSRIAPSTAPPVTTPPPQAPAVPEAPGPFDVSFKPADGDVTSLEVRCGSESGSGVIVDLNQVPKGTACKVTGLGGAAPLQTLVTISAARTYTCFAGGTRACR